MCGRIEHAAGVHRIGAGVRIRLQLPGAGCRRIGQHARLPRTDQIQRRQQRQHHRHAERCGDTIRDQGTDQSTQRARSADPPKCAFGGVRIKVFSNDQPESRTEHRAETRNLQVQRLGRQLWRERQQHPVSQEQGGADGERDRNERSRGDAANTARAQRDEKNRERSRRDDHRRKGGDIEVGEEEGIARGLAGDELRADGTRAYHRGGDRRGRLRLREFHGTRKSQPTLCV